MISLSVAAVYFAKKLHRDRMITQSLQRTTERLERLAFRDPTPTVENIRAARAEVGRISGFLDRVEQTFGSAPCPADLDNRTFRIHLDRTVARLRADAGASGVGIPLQYWFTFDAQKGAMSFLPGSLEPLMMQLGEIDALCQALFAAKVNAIEGLKRTPVDAREEPGSQDFLNAKPITNATTIAVPYEVTFDGFSSELAAVLMELGRAPQCFVVTNLVVGPVEQPVEIPPRMAVPRLLPPAQDGPRVLRDRLPRPGLNRAPVSAGGPRTVLSEKLLRITLSVQAVRLNPANRTLALAPPQPFSLK